MSPQTTSSENSIDGEFKWLFPLNFTIGTIRGEMFGMFSFFLFLLSHYAIYLPYLGRIFDVIQPASLV